MRVFIIGPMGAGKTTIGRQLAAALHQEFVDSDHAIETRTGVDIPTIFDIEGEEGFRKREVAVIDELTQRDGIVLATGGGAVLREENRRHLSGRGLVIYLYATVDRLMERTHRDKNRPLLQTEDPRSRLSELMEVRDPLYRQVADIIYDTGADSVGQAARDLVRLVQDRDHHSR